MSSTVPVSLYLLHIWTTLLWFTLRRLENSFDESPSWHNVTMRIRANVGIDLLDMAELQTAREVYLFPDGMTGTDWLSYPIHPIGIAHAWLFISLCRFSDSDEQSKGLCYWCNINIQCQCSGDHGTEVMQNFFWYVYINSSPYMHLFNINSFRYHRQVMSKYNLISQ